jgi:hypothetical protein
MSTEDRTRTFDSAEMSRRGRIGGYRLAATHNSHETTAPARQGFLGRFLNEVDPDRVLPEPERQRRATAALKAHMSSLARRSAQARRRPR